MRMITGMAVVLSLVGVAQAQDIDPKKQQERIEALEKTVKDLQQKQDAKPKEVQAPPPEGKPSHVQGRDALDDKQEGAPRAQGAVMDPKYRGFFQIPNTPVIMKINAKPHLDVTFDNRNAGDDNRFITAKIPVEGSAAFDDGVRSNINAKGSQLRIDVQAPGVAGNPRFYYQNDFYGSGGGEFPYRIQQFWGQIYNVTVGHTYSVFEDPDAWPDTVDYEGPNAMLFARRALIRYEIPLNEQLSVNLGVEQPESLPADLAGTPDGTVSGINHVPDFAANLRWENEAIGHIQFSGIYRYLAANSSTFGKDETGAWGLSLGTGINLGMDTTLLFLGTVGKGIGSLGNDSGFFNTDAAFDPSGNLSPLPYYSIMIALSHKWSDEFRSTLSYGHVTLDQGDTALDATIYGRTKYLSANVVWQLRKRLSVGAEVLYGSNENQGGAEGHVVRVQFGLVYSLFD